MSKSNPTLEDVAKASEASPATISRFLNSPEKVAKSTGQRIAKAIQELGYTPNFGGRLLATQKANIVGALVPTLSNSVFAGGIQAFQEELARNGMTLLIGSTSYDPDIEFQQIKVLLSHGASGLLLIGNARPKATEEFLKARGVAMVSAWNIAEQDERAFVGFDNYKASVDLTKLVLEMGHRDIAIVHAPTIGNDRAEDRLNAIYNCVEQFGHDARVVGAVEAKYSFEHGAKAFDVVMSRTPKPTVIMAGNDVLAAGLAMRAKALGMSIPDDISITGFDDIALAEFMDPPLTTVKVPQTEMGLHAATQLIAEMNAKGSAKSVELQTLVVRRKSLGPAKA